MPPSPTPLTGMLSDLQRDCLLALPELILSIAILLFLLARLFTSVRRVQIALFAVVVVSLALGIAIDSWKDSVSTSTVAFGGLIRFDTFGLFTRIFLLIAVLVTLVTGIMTGIPDKEDSADFVTLLLGSTVGLMFLSSSNHLLMLFLSAEMASLPAYALTGFLKGKRKGSEAALKYVIYGAAASGVMLYGISLVCAVSGSGNLAGLQKAVFVKEELNMTGVMGACLIFVGLGFKLAVVPFHFWGPDAFEGAAAEVAGFLSVASKGAALVITARFFLSIVGTIFGDGAFMKIAVTGVVIGLIGTITATVGNLLALTQTNLKRLFAYSTIAHAGIMLLAMVPLQSQSMSPILYYLIGYLPANLGIFAVIAFVRNRANSEDISVLTGLGQRSPFLAASLTIFVLSLLGLPPLVGFITKFQIFMNLYEMGSNFGNDSMIVKYLSTTLLIVVGLNTAIGAGYYLKLLKVMYLEDSPSEAPGIPLNFGNQVFFAMLVGTVIGLGILIDPISNLTKQAAISLQGSLR